MGCIEVTMVVVLGITLGLGQDLLPIILVVGEMRGVNCVAINPYNSHY